MAPSKLATNIQMTAKKRINSIEIDLSNDPAKLHKIQSDQQNLKWQPKTYKTQSKLKKSQLPCTFHYLVRILQ